MLKKLFRLFLPEVPQTLSTLDTLTPPYQESPHDEEPFLAKKPVLEQVSSYHERTRWELQEQFDNPPSPQRILKLIPKEYAGPLFITKSMIVDGQGATLWAFKGPVLHLSAPTVVLRNLNVEVTGDALSTFEQECALCVEDQVKLHCENVQIRGHVRGMDKESGTWQYPHSLHLGQLVQYTPYQFLICLEVPIQCHLESAISGLSLSPVVLHPGRREILLNLEPLRQDTALYGSLYLKTAQLKRRIHLTGYTIPQANVPLTPKTPQIIWSPPEKPPRKKIVHSTESEKNSQGENFIRTLSQAGETPQRVLEKNVFFSQGNSPTRLLSDIKKEDKVLYNEKIGKNQFVNNIFLNEKNKK